MFSRIPPRAPSLLTRCAPALGAHTGAKLKTAVLTHHPVTHPGLVLGFMAKHPDWRRMPLGMRLGLLREYEAGQTRPLPPPTHRQECDVQNEALAAHVDTMWEYLQAGRSIAHFEDLVTWGLVDFDGNKPPNGGMIRGRCLETATLCGTYLDKLACLPDRARLAATSLLEDIQHRALALHDLQMEDRPAGDIRAESIELMKKLDVVALEKELLDSLPAGPLKTLAAKAGLRVPCQPRISGKDVDGPKMTELADRILEAGPLGFPDGVTIADCEDAETIVAARKALDDRGLHHVQVIPLFESEKAVTAFTKGAFDHAPFRIAMFARSDLPKGIGPTAALLLTEEAQLKCRATNRIFYCGTGMDTARGGGGHSPLAWKLFAGGFGLGKGSVPGERWDAPDRVTYQGAAHVVSMDARSSALTEPAAGPVLSITPADIARVRKVFAPVIRAELANRVPDGQFALWYMASLMGKLKLEAAGTRDAANKYAQPAQGEQVAHAQLPDAQAIGPYKGRRAIAANALLELCLAYFGSGFASITPDEMKDLVGEINKIMADGTPGEKRLVNELMYPLAIKAARLPGANALANLWQKCRFAPEAAGAMAESAQTVLKLVRETGYTLQDDDFLREMMSELLVTAFDPASAADSVEAIAAQVDKQLQASLAFFDHKIPIGAWEAQGQMFRSYSTAREASDGPPSGVAALEELMVVRG